jgi:uncharacterized protein (TIGR02598 family)
VKAKSRVVRGFSLVEVALALAILAFSMLTLLALLSEGVGSYRDAGAQSTMVNIATMVVRDLQATPPGTSAESSPEYGFTVPAAGGTASGTTPQTVYVDVNGTATATTVGAAPTSSSIYRISVYFTPPPTAGQRTATLARLLITFPAQADSTATSSPTLYTDVFQTMVSLNRN